MELKESEEEEIAERVALPLAKLPKDEGQPEDEDQHWNGFSNLQHYMNIAYELAAPY